MRRIQHKEFQNGTVERLGESISRTVSGYAGVDDVGNW